MGGDEKIREQVLKLAKRVDKAFMDQWERGMISVIIGIFIIVFLVLSRDIAATLKFLSRSSGSGRRAEDALCQSNFSPFTKKRRVHYERCEAVSHNGSLGALH